MSPLAPRGLALLAAGLAAIVASRGFGAPALATLGAGLVALPVMAASLATLVAAGLRLERGGAPPHPRAGQTLQATVRVGGWPVRTRLTRLVDVTLEPGLDALGRVTPEAARATGPRLDGAWRVAEARRGGHILPAPRAVVRDPFGLAHARSGGRSGAPERLVVRPRAPRLARVPLLEALGATSRRGREPSWGELERVRDYRAGDSLARVHWGQTAKRGRLQTKELRTGDDTHALVVLSLDRRAADPVAFETAVTATAAIARHLSEHGVPVALAGERGAPGLVFEPPGPACLGWPAIEWALATARMVSGTGAPPPPLRPAPARVAGRPVGTTLLMSAGGAGAVRALVGVAAGAVLVAAPPHALAGARRAGVTTLALGRGDDVAVALAGRPQLVASPGARGRAWTRSHA